MDDVLDFVSLLLDAGADPNATREFDPNTPLHLVSGLNLIPWPGVTTDLVGLLLEAGTDPNARDRCGSSPLHGAVSNEDHTRLLLAADADPNFVDCRGRTPLDEASRFGREDIVQLLRDAGAK